MEAQRRVEIKSIGSLVHATWYPLEKKPFIQKSLTPHMHRSRLQFFFRHRETVLAGILNKKHADFYHRLELYRKQAHILDPPSGLRYRRDGYVRTKVWPKAVNLQEACQIPPQCRWTSRTIKVHLNLQAWSYLQVNTENKKHTTTQPKKLYNHSCNSKFETGIMRGA